MPQPAQEHGVSKGQFKGKVKRKYTGMNSDEQRRSGDSQLYDQQPSKKNPKQVQLKRKYTGMNSDEASQERKSVDSSHSPDQQKNARLKMKIKM